MNILSIQAYISTAVRNDACKRWVYLLLWTVHKPWLPYPGAPSITAPQTCLVRTRLPRAGAFIHPAVRPDTLANGQLRLVTGGLVPNLGRLEVAVNGLWGAVDIGGWGWPESLVACRALGYKGMGASKASAWPCWATGPRVRAVLHTLPSLSVPCDGRLYLFLIDYI
jgi:hypothetical protein